MEYRDYVEMVQARQYAEQHNLAYSRFFFASLCNSMGAKVDVQRFLPLPLIDRDEKESKLAIANEVMKHAKELAERRKLNNNGS